MFDSERTESPYLTCDPLALKLIDLRDTHTLHILKCHVYDSCCHSCAMDGKYMLEFEQWYNQREYLGPHFQYWETVMQLQLCILTYGAIIFILGP